MIDYNELDPGVVEMVKYFNENGLKTIMSCEGHNDTNLSRFWIGFTGPDIEKKIVEFQRKHLDKLGQFCANGIFGTRIWSHPTGSIVNYEYTAAGKVAADADLKRWKEDDAGGNLMGKIGQWYADNLEYLRENYGGKVACLQVGRVLCTADNLTEAINLGEEMAPEGTFMTCYIKPLEK